MERQFVVVAFSDILGFTAWTRRALNSFEVTEPFVIQFYAEIEKFTLQHQQVYVKYLGDGLMILKEIPKDRKENDCVHFFIKKVVQLNKRLAEIVKACDWPAPEGMRTRIACGHVNKIQIIDPQNRSKKVPEYVGYPINLAQRLLEVAPKVPVIFHESIVKFIGKKKPAFKIRRLVNTTERPRGIDVDDFEGLWVLQS